MKTKEVIERLKILSNILKESDSDTFVNAADRDFVSGFNEALTRAIDILSFMIERNKIKNQNCNGRSTKRT